MAQFLRESMLLAGFSGAIALLMAWSMLPNFSVLTGFNAGTNALFDSQHVFVLILATVSIGFLACLYPAVYLSSLKSVDSLKGKFS